MAGAGDVVQGEAEDQGGDVHAEGVCAQVVGRDVHRAEKAGYRDGEGQPGGAAGEADGGVGVAVRGWQAAKNDVFCLPACRFRLDGIGVFACCFRCGGRVVRAVG